MSVLVNLNVGLKLIMYLLPPLACKMERKVTVTYRYASNLTILYMNNGFTVEHVVLQCVEQYNHRKHTVH